MLGAPIMKCVGMQCRVRVRGEVSWYLGFRVGASPTQPLVIIEYFGTNDSSGRYRAIWDQCDSQVQVLDLALATFQV